MSYQPIERSDNMPSGEGGFKTYLPYIVIAGLIIYIFFQNGCSGDKDTITITTPEVKGKSDTIYLPPPMPQKEKEYVYITKTKEGRIDTIKVANPINDELWRYYQDSKAKDSLYADAIGEREYNIPIEDSLLLTNNYIKSQGKVLAFQQTYTIKPRKITVKDPSNGFKLTGGFEVGNTIQLDKFAVKGNLGIGLGKGAINLGYDTNNTIWLGYNWTIIK